MKNLDERVKNTFDPLLSLKVPPKRIHYFADNPIAPFLFVKKGDNLQNVLRNGFVSHN